MRTEKYGAAGIWPSVDGWVFVGEKETCPAKDTHPYLYTHKITYKINEFLP